VKFKEFFKPEGVILLRYKRQKGAALITAILITALAAMIATRLAWDTQHLINQRYLVKSHQSINNALLAARTLESAKLLQLAHSNKANQYAINAIPKNMRHDNVDILGYKIKSTLEDAKARFNINHISKQGDKASSYINFADALTLGDRSLNTDSARALASEIANWSSAIHDTNLDSYYEKKGLGYAPAHQPFIDSSSLIMLKGFNAKIVAALRPHLIALPTSRCANFNSVTDPFVLKACGLSDQQIAAAVSCKMEHTFTSAKQVLDCIGKSDSGSGTNIDFATKYFLLTSCAVDPDSATSPCLQSLLFLSTSANGLEISVLWQRGNATMLPQSVQEPV
jgi:general secretion pathway protein K